MSENNIEPAVIKKTQESLGKFIKKPSLTEKLLKRPPFRFLLDIVNAVIKETGYFNDLYTKDELDSDNIKDRDGKMQFLQKLIDVIKIALNNDEEISKIRPSKIVAGHEPEKTNALLQAIARIIEEEIDLNHAINTVKNNANVKPTKTKATVKTKTKTEVNPENVNKTEIPSSSKMITTNKGVEKNEDKIKEKIKNEDKKKTIKSSNENHKVDIGNDKKKTLSKEKDVKVSKSKVKETTAGVQKENKSKTKASTDKNKGKITSKKETNVKNSRKSNLKNIEKQISVENSNAIGDGNRHEKETIVIKENESNQKQEQEQEKRKNSNSSLIDVNSIDSIKKEIRAVNNENEKQSLKLDSGNSSKNSGSIRRRSLKSKNENDERKSSSGKEKSISDDVRFNDDISSKTESHKEQISSNLMSTTNKSEQEQQIRNNIIKPESATKQITALSSSSSPPSSTPSATTPTAEIKRQSTFIREKTNENGDQPKTSLRPPSVRPPSARPGAPKRRDKNVEIILEPNDSIKMAGINVKLDNLNTELEDDGENLVIIENPEQILNQKSDNNQSSENELLQNHEMNTQQGHLVQKILETQKELVQTNKNMTEMNTAEDLDIATIQKRQNSAKQINSLKDTIQNLTRSINPLGKLMDFIPEDVDSMQLELTMWRDTYLQAEAELKKEKLLTESVVEPLKKQLEQIDANIKECVEMINASRARILANSQKISSLLLDQ